MTLRFFLAPNIHELLHSCLSERSISAKNSYTQTQFQPLTTHWLSASRKSTPR